MDRIEFSGDNPQARFGHTITPISKDKALLFGGAVGDTGIKLIIKENISSLEILSYVITHYANGKNYKVMEPYQRIEQHTHHSQSITSFSYLEEL